MGLLDLLTDNPDLARSTPLRRSDQTAAARPRARRQPVTRTIARNAFDAAAEISCAQTVAELEAAMRRGTMPLGFTVAVLGEMRNDQVRFIAGAPPKAYIERFVNCPTMTEDVVYRAMFEWRRPFFWSEVTSQPGLTPAQQRMIDERAEFGFREGLISALPHRDGRVTFVALAGQHINVADPEVCAAAHVLASCYGIVARRMTFADTPSRVVLTRRQTDCLCWAREGKSTADIAVILGISTHTAQEHITDACARLGVRTRVQAVASALARNLIQP